MKVALAIAYFNTSGEYRREMLRIANALVEQNCEVVIYCLKWSAPRVDPRIKVVQFRPKWDFGFCSTLWFFARKLQESLEKDKVDCSVAFSRVPGCDFYFAYDNPAAETFHRVKSFLKYFMLGKRSALKLEDAIFNEESNTKIFHLSDFQKKRYINWYETQNERFILLPPGIPHELKDQSQREEKRDSFRKKQHIEDDEIVLLMRGSGFRATGIDRGIAAFASIPKEYRKMCKLVICAHGEIEVMRKLADELGVSKYLLFLNPDKHDIYSVVAGSDLMIHMPRQLSADSAPLEAIVSGVPVIGVEDYIYASHIESSGGVLVTYPFERKTFARVLCMVISTPEKLEEMKREASAYGEQADFYHRVEVVVKHIMEFGQNNG
jgi:UDP-glucose:(heptosyl)LPS alpha-1,3-glucosyltransferase